MEEAIEIRPMARHKTDWVGVAILAVVVVMTLFASSQSGSETPSTPITDPSVIVDSETFQRATLQQQADQIAASWAFHFATGNGEVLGATLQLARQATGCQVRPYEFRIPAGERRTVRHHARELALRVAAAYRAEAVGVAEHPIPITSSPLLADSRDPAVAVLAMAFLYACTPEIERR